MSFEIDYDNYTSSEGNYTLDQVHGIFDWAELVPTLVVYLTTFVVGLIGNCLIIFATLRYRRMQSVTNTFLSSLACSDLLIIFCIPVKLAKLFSYTWTMGAFICKSLHYMENVSAICSVLVLTAISVERYYAIVYPIKAKSICTLRKARRIIFAIWISSVILGIPTIFAQTHLPVGLNHEYFWCVKCWDEPGLWKFHEIYMFYVILVIPFCIMAFCYSIICYELCKIAERRFVMTSEHALSRKSTKKKSNDPIESFHLTDLKENGTNDNRRNEKDNIMVKQVIYMLLAVVFVFAICWTPVLLLNILMSFNVLPSAPVGILKYMKTAFHLMAYFNSCINPVIYGFMSKTFRQSFWRTLGCCTKPEIIRRADSSTYRNSSRYNLTRMSTLR